jgi:hypothetical protein
LGARFVKRPWSASRFDETPEDPQASLVNLVDIMLVFICGLIVALVSADAQRAAQSATPSNSTSGGAKSTSDSKTATQFVEQGRELTDLPEGLRGQAAGAGMTPVGQVYRDPKTGKLILVGH